MIPLISVITIALRKRLPQTPEDYFALGTIGILYFFYASRKGKWFMGTFKWIIATLIFWGGLIGLFYFTRRWFRFFCWSLTSPLMYVILYTIFRNFLIRRKHSESYLYEDKKEDLNQLSDQDDLDMHKIIVLAIVLWILAGLFIA